MEVSTRPPAATTETIPTPAPDPVASQRTPWILGAGLLAAVAYAAFASGAAGLPEEARLQVGLAAIAVVALAALLFGRGLRLVAHPAALGGLVLLGGFTLWTGLSLEWSIAPDRTWTELNRTTAYLLVLALALVLGSSMPRALERTAIGFLAVAVLVSVYALGGKLVPGLDVGPLDLDHTADFSRLRAPFGYWNALAIFCVLAVPIALRAAADLERSARVRLGALVALPPLLITIALTYSRGGIAALVIALAVLLAIGPDRLRLLACALVALAGAAPPLVVAFARDDLTKDVLRVSERSDDGVLLALALLLGVVNVLVLGALLQRAGRRSGAGDRVSRLAPVVALVGVAAGVAVTLGVLAASDRGLGGTISHEWREFRSVDYDRQNDPARILKTNSGNRWVWWEEAAGAWWDRPLAGHGAGSFERLHLAYRENQLEVRQAHSVPLELLAGRGLVGAGLFLGGLGLLGAAGVARLRTASGRERAYAGALLAGAGAWGVHMWLDWDLDIPGVTLPLLVFLGALAARPAAPAPGAGAPRLARRGLALALGTALLCAAAISAAMPSLARDRTSEALSEANGGDLAEGLSEARIAMDLNPYAVEPVFAAATIANRAGRFDEAADLLAEAADRQPRNAAVWLRVAGLYSAAGDAAAFRRFAAVFARLDPRSPLLDRFSAVGLEGNRSTSATGTPLPEAPPPQPAPPPSAPPAGSTPPGSPPPASPQVLPPVGGQP